MQLLESEDDKLIGLIHKAEDVVKMVQSIADKNVESDEEEAEDGEGEVVALARRASELLDKGPASRPGLVEG